jgi:hypothetical protein
MFRSFKMVVVSLIQIYATDDHHGLMGILNSLKPLLYGFNFAFGLSVDDTFTFWLNTVKLTNNNWKIKKSVFATIKESGISMFYTSVVLFAGFSVFMLSILGHSSS